jgi:hypothetical protein
MENEIRQLNDALQTVMGLEPLTEIQPEANANSAGMNYGLAQVYANEGFREYMNMEINRQMVSTLTAETLVGLAERKARVLTLRELLVRGKRAFDELQKIQKLTQNK